MTKPTITAGWGFMTDCSATTECAYGAAGSYAWTETQGAGAADLVAALTSNGDKFTITGTCDNAAAEYAFYSYPDEAHGGAPAEADLNISRVSYPYFAIRYKTSGAAAASGIAARVSWLCHSGHENFILGATAPGAFSTAWKWATGSIATCSTCGNNIIEHVRIYAYEDGATNGTYYVYYDKILFFNTTITIPFVSPGGLRVNRPQGTIDIGIPGRETDVTQQLGSRSIEIALTGEYDTNTSWNPDGSSYPPGELFNWLHHTASTGQYWQYFTSDRYRGAVSVRDFNDGQTSDGNYLGPWQLWLKEYRLVAPSDETWQERYGFP